MKIALTADPEIPVPPLLYGGIERIIAMLVDEYLAAGHEVTLFAHEDSVSNANLIPYKGKTSELHFDTLKNIHLITKEIYKGDYDILHSFSRLAYLTFVLPFKLPKIMSYQREPTPSQIKKARKLSYKQSLTFTGCSNFISNQIKPYAQVNTIYNGFPESNYQLSPTISKESPLVFLGRLEPIKGPHHAIDIALRSNKKLIIAGNIPTDHQKYFDEKIKPYIDDRQICYIGPVNDVEKSKLLSKALAFLMPIEWDEPFGIVMVEAMACGTPVIALSRGAIPEIIKHGVTGFICNSIEQCIEVLSQVYSLDRSVIRQDALTRFSSKVIAHNYLQLYKTVVNRK
ncbi:MAG: glycosyltransferase family 4 protein [Daejeonella sp.]|nr:glycosyltransferase family 4 protein [Daejeonella sp.]